MQQINVVLDGCSKPFITAANHLVSLLMLVLVQLVGCMRVLRERVCQSVQQESCFLD